MYLKAADLAHKNPQKKKRRKLVRYEREHSLSAGHIDWGMNQVGLISRFALSSMMHPE